MELSLENIINFEFQDSPMLTHLKTNSYSLFSHNMAQKQQNDWIDEYLLPQALNQNHLKQIVSIDRTHESEPCDDKFEKQIEQTVENKYKKNRSIFHNIHKNLITFIKKLHIRRIDLVSNSGGLRAYDLWRIFKTSKDFSKKSLYILFGAQEGLNAQYLRKAASSTPDLKSLLKKYPLSDLQRAQNLLREKILLAISKLQKEAIEKMCKMSSFEDFYTYLQCFKEQLQGDGLAIRMKKTRKQEIVEKRMNQRETSD